MPRQVYRCPRGHESEVPVPIREDVPEKQRCPHSEDLGGGEVVLCGLSASWVPSAPNFIGGPTTGAQKE